MSLALVVLSFGQVKGPTNNLENPTVVRPASKGSVISPIEAELRERGQVSMGRTSCGGSGYGDSIPKTPVEIMHGLLCGSSAVVVGTAVSKESKLDSDGSWIITDYAIHVEKIFKNDNAAAIRRGGNVTITVPGGQISIDGKIATAKDNDYAFLNSADLYILFLERTPSGGYITQTGSGYISAADGSLYSLRAQPFGAEQTSMNYLDLIGAASKMPCVSPKK